MTLACDIRSLPDWGAQMSFPSLVMASRIAAPRAVISRWIPSEALAVYQLELCFISVPGYCARFPCPTSRPGMQNALGYSENTIGCPRRALCA
jgi:hypothetical protein